MYIVSTRSMVGATRSPSLSSQVLICGIRVHLHFVVVIHHSIYSSKSKMAKR